MFLVWNFNIPRLAASHYQTSQVSRFSGQSHGLMMRHKNLTVNRFTSWWNTLFEYVHFCLVKLIFRRQFCRNPQFRGIFVIFDHLVDKVWTSKPYLEDKWQIRLSLLVRCIKIRFLLSKWRKCMNIHWAKTKFKIEWESSYPVKHILGDPFFVFMCSLHLVFYPKFPGFLTLISRFLVFWGWEVCSQLWDHADMDTSLASSKSLYLNPKSNIRIGYI